MWRTLDIYFLTRVQVIVARSGDQPQRPRRPRQSRCIERRLLEEGNNYGFAGGLYGWQQSPVYRNDAGEPLPNTGEEFADMFLGWNYNTWVPITSNDFLAGQARANFMERHLASWIALVINQEMRGTR